jgi:hypothetical protein
MSANHEPHERPKPPSVASMAMWILIVVLAILTIIVMVWARSKPDYTIVPTKPLSVLLARQPQLWELYR